MRISLSNKGEGHRAVALTFDRRALLPLEGDVLLAGLFSGPRSTPGECKIQLWPVGFSIGRRRRTRVLVVREAVRGAMSSMTTPRVGSCTPPLCLARRLRLWRSTIATPMQAPRAAIPLTTAPMMMPIEPLVSSAKSTRPSNTSIEGGGGGEMSATIGGVKTASTAIETPVTFASMSVALLGLLVALAIVDCTKAAITAKGSYFPPGRNPPAGERKLFFLIESDSDANVRAARKELKRSLDEHAALGAPAEADRYAKYKI